MGVEGFSRIEQRSPHVAGAIRRWLAPPQWSIVIPALVYALEHGGEQEPGFVRPPGQSYNPRPARVALILIGDAGVRDGRTIAAAVYACAAGAPCGGDSGLQQLTGLMRLPWPELARQSGELRGPAICGAAALFLDRVRHLHLTAAGRDAQQRAALVDDARGYSALAAPDAPRLSELLDSWIDRLQRFAEKGVGQ